MKATPGSSCGASSNCARTTGLEISDRIVIHITASPALHQLLHSFGSYVREETLAVDLHQLGADEQFPVHLLKDTFELDNEQVTVAVAKK